MDLPSLDAPEARGDPHTIGAGCIDLARIEGSTSEPGDIVSGRACNSAPSAWTEIRRRIRRAGSCDDRIAAVQRVIGRQPGSASGRAIIGIATAPGCGCQVIRRCPRGGCKQDE